MREKLSYHIPTIRTLLDLYNDYCNALIEHEERGQGNYTDEDFNSLQSFMTFVKNNYLQEDNNV